MVFEIYCSKLYKSFAILPRIDIDWFGIGVGIRFTWLMWYVTIRKVNIKL